MQQFNAKDPDANIVVIFRNISVPNDHQSALANRPIFEDREECELHYPGRRDWSSHPATSFSHWDTDPLTGAQRPVTYAERFAKQYQQFKSKAQQTKAGTPLEYALFLTEARRSELRAMNVYTIEQLANVDGQDLKNLGPMGREAKNKAMEYLEQSNSGIANRKLEAELSAARERAAMLEEDMKILRAKVAMKEDSASDFDDMSVEQLRDYITANSGHAPKGDLKAINRKTLIRMAESCRPVAGET